MRLPETTRLAKVNALIALAALILYIVAFSSNYWLKKNFDFPVNAGGVATIPVHATIGLFTACKTEFYPNNRSTENCSPDGAADWQFISAGLSIVGLVIGLVGTVLAVLGVLLQRAADSVRVKLAIVLSYFLSCSFGVGPLIMFPMNRKIQVRPNQSAFQADFDLSWSYTISVISVGLFSVLVLLNITDIIWSPNNGSKDKKEDQEALSKETNNLS